jgi:hypothetical protein
MALTFPISRPSVIYPHCDFWFENMPSGNPVVETILVAQIFKKVKKLLHTRTCPNSYIVFLSIQCFHWTGPGAWTRQRVLSTRVSHSHEICASYLLITSQEMVPLSRRRISLHQKSQIFAENGATPTSPVTPPFCLHFRLFKLSRSNRLIPPL